MAARSRILGLAIFLASTNADAFVHIVRHGESLADIANRVYGEAKLETVLAGANFLDVLLEVFMLLLQVTQNFALLQYSGS